MALEEHPHVFRYDGRLWVSALPGAEARAQLVAQRAWDNAHLKSQHWTAAIVIGAIVGTGVMLGLGVATGLAPAIYLVLLPLAFGAGAVLGAWAAHAWTRGHAGWLLSMTAEEESTAPGGSSHAPTDPEPLGDQGTADRLLVTWLKV